MPFRKKKVYARFNVATMMRQLKEVRERTALEQEKVLAATRDLQAKQAKVRRIQQKVINVLRFLIELLIVVRKPIRSTTNRISLNPSFTGAIKLFFTLRKSEIFTEPKFCIEYLFSLL